MSFALLSVIFMLGSLLLLLVAVRLRRLSLRSILPGLSFALAVLVILTAVFDNVMIASGLFDYGEQALLGIRVGLAPLEDFSYPVSVVLFGPALWWLAGGSLPKNPAREHSTARTTGKED